MSTFGRIKARVWAWLTTTPPEVVRTPLSAHELYRQKYSALRRAYRESRLDDVRRLTAECRELRKEMEVQQK